MSLNKLHLLNLNNFDIKIMDRETKYGLDLNHTKEMFGTFTSEDYSYESDCFQRRYDWRHTMAIAS